MKRKRARTLERAAEAAGSLIKPRFWRSLAAARILSMRCMGLRVQGNQSSKSEE